MEGVLGNVAAGLTIIFTQPFHLGDCISIAKQEGEVLDISLFSTTLGHTDRSKVVIPNQAILETFRARNVVIPLPQLEVRMPESAA